VRSGIHYIRTVQRIHGKVSAIISVANWLQGEAPLLFKPYIKDLTKSEIHAVMTEGFATVAGKSVGNGPG
jgi:nucleoside permease NupC